VAIQSMTGFGRSTVDSERYSVTIEIKSVNNRYKDFRFKMPSFFNASENIFRTLLLEHFKRGSFDIYINYKSVDKMAKFENLDMDKVRSFIKLFESEGLSVSPVSFLRNEFYASDDEEKNTELIELGTKAFKEACLSLKEARLSEGEKLKIVMNSHLEQFITFYSQVPELSENIEKDIRDKLTKRMSEFNDQQIDEPRFLQEVVYYLEKLDVHEEINRIGAHLEKLKTLIAGTGEVGRQIDFMVQELNRETNTIGSKSSHEVLSNCVIQMKVQLEKMREQGLNLE